MATRIRRFSPQTVSVLLALGERASGWTHGYDLCRTLDLKPGTVYPILIRLAERGIVVTEWETDAPQGRPPRHLYRLSPDAVELVQGLRRDAAAHTATSASSAARTARPAHGMALG